MEMRDELEKLALTIIQRIYPDETIDYAREFLAIAEDFVHPTNAHKIYSIFNCSGFTPDIVNSFSVDALVYFASIARISDGHLKLDKIHHFFDPINQYSGSDLFVDKFTGKALSDKRMGKFFNSYEKGFKLFQVYQSALYQFVINSDNIDTHNEALRHNENFYDKVEDLGRNEALIHSAIEWHYSYTKYLPEEITAPDEYVRKLLVAMKSKGDKGFYENYNPKFSAVCGHHVIRQVISGHYCVLKNHQDKDLYGEIIAKFIEDGADWYKGLCIGLDDISNLDQEDLSEDDKVKHLVKIATKSYLGKELYGPTLKLISGDVLKKNTPRIHLKKMSEMTGDDSFMQNATKRSKRMKVIEDLGI